MFKSDFADSSVPDFSEKSLNEQSSLILHELSGSILFVFMQNKFHFIL